MNPAAPSKFRYSVLLYLGTAFIAFFPCLLLGQSYFANDLLNQYSHFRFLIKSQLAQGHFPLWNPYFFGGQPFFADPNAMMCYPLLYPTLLFPIPYGLSVFFFLHMALAAFGMHFWLKSLRLSEGACRLGALTFALAGSFWWELIHPPILAVYAWFPWMMFCLEKLSQKLEKGRAFGAGLCLAVVFCCGNFQAFTGVLYTGLAYFFFRFLTREDGSTLRPFPWKKFLTAGLFVVWAGAPLLCHFIPVYEFSKYTNRRDAQQTYDNFNGQFSMTPKSSYEFLYPDLGVPPGNTIEMAIQSITDRVDIGNDFLGAFGYIGIWVPFFIFLAFRRKEKKFQYFLLGAGLLSIATAWGRYFPLHRMECLLLPGVNLSRAPFRFIETYVLFGCVLLAYGYQTLERWFSEKDLRPNWAWGAALYAALLFLPGLLRPDQAWREMLALGLGLAGFLLGFLTDSWKPLGKGLLLAALLLPLLLSGWGDFSTGPSSNYDLKARFPAFAYLEGHREGCRYYFSQDLTYPVQMGNRTYDWTFPQDGPMDLGIRQSAGYNPIVLDKTSEISRLPAATYFNLMAVRGIVTGREMGESPDFLHQSFGSTHVYEFKSPPPYVYAPEETRVLPDEGQVLAALKQPGFSPEKTAYLYAPLPPGAASTPPTPHSGFSYDILEDGMNEQTFHVHMDKAGTVVFSAVMFPGWKAFLDGRPVPLLTADYDFRALEVPPGDHQVRFDFVPGWWLPLKVLLSLWVLSALGFGLFLLKKKPSLDPAQA